MSCKKYFLNISQQQKNPRADFFVVVGALLCWPVCELQTNVLCECRHWPTEWTTTCTHEYIELTISVKTSSLCR